MALTKEQYDKLMLEYQQRRDKHRCEIMRRKRKIYAQIPEYHKLDLQVADLSMQELKTRLYDKENASALPSRLLSISKEKSALLLSHGYPADYLDMTYDCPDCKDTGYIDGKKCHCFRQQEIRILYRQSHLEKLLETNNFDLLSTKYYKGDDKENFLMIVSACRNFIQNFDSTYENLLFYGNVGTGKTFLSICIAGELLNSGHTVLYFSSKGLFNELRRNIIYQSDQNFDYLDFTQTLYTCDLLVIDDLGTENPSSFIIEQLFALITERDLNQKSTIISSNLTPASLHDHYEDRTFSRIFSNYKLYKFSGPDIRIEIKRNIDKVSRLSK